VPETAGTLRGNAELKALAYSQAGLAIASDGGLEVPALGQAWDPVLTRRSGQARLRELSRGLVDSRLIWREAVAIAENGRLLGSWEEAGTTGVLARQPWPAPRVFWVWDIFFFPELGKTWAQLSPEERQQVDLTWTRLRATIVATFRVSFT